MLRMRVANTSYAGGEYFVCGWRILRMRVANTSPNLVDDSYAGGEYFTEFDRFLTK